MNPEAKIMLDHCASLGITHGRMLDLGAGNDVEGDSSVALPFIERGWDVVLVDAAPACVEILAAKYGRHPKVKVVQALVGRSGGHLWPFYEIPADPVLSTVSDALMGRKVGREDFREIYMQAVDCAELWGQLGPFDVVSIDLEGVSICVAERLLECGSYAVRAICVEVFPSEVLGVDEAAVLEKLAPDYGLKVAALTKENMILVRA